MGQLVGLSDEGLSLLPNVGRQSIEAIKAKREEWIQSNRATINGALDEVVLPDDKVEFYTKLAGNLRCIAPFTAKSIYKTLENRREFFLFR